MERKHRRNRLSPLQIAVHVGAWIPLLVLINDFRLDHLTVNPIQAAEIRTGDIALILLALSLACTPINTVFKIPQVNKVRTPLGLYGYMYAAIHLLIFTGLDYAFDLQQLLQVVTEKPYIIVGLISFLGLSVLAITSFRKWQVRLKKNWKRLHQMIYAINLLIVLHFAWSVKGNLFKLQGDIYRPFLAALAVITLLVLRLPAVRRAIAGQYQRKPAESSKFSLKHDNLERDKTVERDRQTIRDETAVR